MKDKTEQGRQTTVQKLPSSMGPNATCIENRITIRALVLANAMALSAVVSPRVDVGEGGIDWTLGAPNLLWTRGFVGGRLVVGWLFVVIRLIGVGWKCEVVLLGLAHVLGIIRLR